MKKTSTQFVAASLSLVFWGMGASAQAQGQEVLETEVVVNGIRRAGQGITLQLDRGVVEQSWKNYLKEQAGTNIKGTFLWPFARVKAPREIYVVEKGEIESISNNELKIVSRVGGGPKSTTVWWALEMGRKSLSQEQNPEEWNRSASFLRQFSRKIYLEEIQLEADYVEDVVLYSKEEAKQMELTASKIQAVISKKQQKKAKMELALAAKKNNLKGENQPSGRSLVRQELALNAATRELDNLDKRLQRVMIRQEVARQEMEIMSQTMETVKARMNNFN